MYNRQEWYLCTIQHTYTSKVSLPYGQKIRLLHEGLETIPGSVLSIKTEVSRSRNGASELICKRGLPRLGLKELETEMFLMNDQAIIRVHGKSALSSKMVIGGSGSLDCIS